MRERSDRGERGSERGERVRGRSERGERGSERGERGRGRRVLALFDRSLRLTFSIFRPVVNGDGEIG